VEERGAVVAVDFGERRTGLAACDALRIAAMPIAVIVTEDREELLERIVNAVDDRGATTVVVGLPLHLAGHESARSRRVHELSASLRKRLPHVDVVELDERLTTKEANSLLAEGGVHWRKRKKQIDAVAAVVLLRAYLQSRLDPP
jgi:putative Holliday junction resolvase